MKKNLFTLLMVFGCVGLFAACSSSSKDEVVEIDSPSWEAVNDRLQRAAAAFEGE